VKYASRPPSASSSAAVLTGVLAVLDGAIWAGRFGEQTAGKIAERFAQEGLLTADYDQSCPASGAGGAESAAPVCRWRVRQPAGIDRSRPEHATAGARPDRCRHAGWVQGYLCPIGYVRISFRIFFALSTPGCTLQNLRRAFSAFTAACLALLPVRR
jgi:hypothetical protein